MPDRNRLNFMNSQNIYQRAINNGCRFVCSCVGIGQEKWDELMKGARHADRKKVVRIALQAGIIDEEQAKEEIKRPYYNPYEHFVTRTHIVYVHSAIEHFIEVY